MYQYTTVVDNNNDNNNMYLQQKYRQNVHV